MFDEKVLGSQPVQIDLPDGLRIRGPGKLDQFLIEPVQGLGLDPAQSVLAPGRQTFPLRHQAIVSQTSPWIIIVGFM